MDYSLLFQTLENCCRNKDLIDFAQFEVVLKKMHIITSETWWELHLSEGFDWRRNDVSINQDMKLLPDAFMSGIWHVQDVAWRLPTVRRINWN